MAGVNIGDLFCCIPPPLTPPREGEGDSQHKLPALDGKLLSEYVLATLFDSRLIKDEGDFVPKLRRDLSLVPLPLTGRG